MSFSLRICSLALLFSLPDYVCTCMCVIHIRRHIIAWIYIFTGRLWFSLHHYIHSIFILSPYVCSRWHLKRRARSDSLTCLSKYIATALSRGLELYEFTLLHVPMRCSSNRSTNVSEEISACHLAHYDLYISRMHRSVRVKWRPDRATLGLALIIFRCHPGVSLDRFHFVAFVLRLTLYHSVRVPWSFNLNFFHVSRPSRFCADLSRYFLFSFVRVTRVCIARPSSRSFTSINTIDNLTLVMGS